jgi:hypothetical protein
MQLPIHLRRTIAELALLCAVSLASGLMLPAYSVASQTGTPAQTGTGTEERVTHEEELDTHQQERSARERERAEARTAREQEREALRTKHEEERAAKRNSDGSGHNGSGGAGEAGTGSASDPTSGEASTDASAKALHGCRLSIEASAQRITAGESVTLAGTLTCPTASTTHQTDTDGQTSTAAQTIAAGQQVALYVRQLGNSLQTQQNPAAAQTASTTADGSYELTSPVLDKTSILQVRVGTHHTRVVVKVAPLITLSTPTTSSLQASSAAVLPQDSQPQPGASTTADSTTSTTVTATRVTFSGTVSPAVEGERVTLQISYPTTTDEHWQTVAYGRVGVEGSYAIAHDFHHPGKVNVRAVVHPHGPDVKGISTPVAYEVLELSPSPAGLASQLTTPPVAPANA